MITRQDFKSLTSGVLTHDLQTVSAHFSAKYPRLFAPITFA